MRNTGKRTRTIGMMCAAIVLAGIGLSDSMRAVAQIADSTSQPFSLPTIWEFSASTGTPPPLGSSGGGKQDERVLVMARK